MKIFQLRKEKSLQRKQKQYILKKEAREKPDDKRERHQN